MKRACLHQLYQPLRRISVCELVISVSRGVTKTSKSVLIKHDYVICHSNVGYTHMHVTSNTAPWNPKPTKVLLIVAAMLRRAQKHWI